MTGVDLFGDRDTRQACHRHFLIADDEPADDRLAAACEGIPVLQVGGLKSQLRLIQRLREACPTLGPADAVCEQLTNTDALRSLAAETGWSFPETLDERIDQRACTVDGGRWLRKQRYGCGGLGVRPAIDGEMPDRDEVIQRWVPGRNFGASLLSDGSATRLLGVCRSLFTRKLGRPFVYAGSFGPVPMAPAISETLEALGQLVVQRTGLRGLFNVDFLLDAEQRPWLLEINPRWSGSSELIERWLTDQQVLAATDSLLGLSIDSYPSKDRAAVLSLTNVRPATNVRYLKRIIYAPAELQFSSELFTLLIDRGVSCHDLPSDGTLIGRHQPVMTVITEIDVTNGEPLRPYREMMGRLRERMKKSPIAPRS